MSKLNLGIAAPEVQAAALSILTGNAPHMALVAGGVHDHVGEGTAFPFEALGLLSETWADGFTDAFRLVMMQWDVWSRYHGRKEAQDIQASQVALLNRVTLPLATLHCVYCRLDYADVLEDPDGITWHGVTRYLVLVEATS